MYSALQPYVPDSPLARCCMPRNSALLAENLRVEVWGPFLTVSGTRKGGAMGMRDLAPRSTAQRSALGGKGVVLRRETDYGFFSASWRLPVRRLSMLPDLGLCVAHEDI